MGHRGVRKCQWAVKVSKSQKLGVKGVSRLRVWHHWSEKGYKETVTVKPLGVSSKGGGCV